MGNAEGGGAHPGGTAAPSLPRARARSLAFALDAAKQGQGSLVLIAGAAGTGKSTLLEAAVRLAASTAVGA
jgi:predicted ATP-dependent serine protease